MKTRTALFWIVSALLVVVFYVAAGMPEIRLLSKTKIGRVDIEGVITSSEEINDQIDSFRRDDSIGAVILRVDSPGGGVGPSQEIFREIVRLRDDGKYVVVSMGSVAASGGYYVSCPADYIFANPGTITGSVGVIAEFTNLEGLLGKVGVKVQPFTSGKLKDVGSPFRQMDDQDKAFVQGLVDETYAQFLEDVVRERQLTEESSSAIRDGRIVVGSQALRLGLVDELGNFKDAVDHTAHRLGITPPRRLVERKPRKGLLDILRDPASTLVPASLRRPWGLSLSYLYAP